MSPSFCQPVARVLHKYGVAIALKHHRLSLISSLALIMWSATALTAKTAELPSIPGLNFQTSGPARCANIGDWYTTDNKSGCSVNGGTSTNSTDKIHRFFVDINQDMLDAAGGSVDIVINDAESSTGSGPIDEVISDQPDPTRFELRTADGITVLQSETVPSGSPNGTNITFTVTEAGTYQVTSVTGAGPIFADNTTSLNDDDNSFIITVPDSGGAPELQALIGQFQSTFQQNSGSNLDIELYFLVGPGTESLYLRNFDIDNKGTITYVSPNGDTIPGTLSGNAVWNNDGNLNTGGDTISGLTPADAGLWKLRINNLNENNQLIVEANTGDISGGERLPLYDRAISRAGNFSIESDTTESTSPGTSVDHIFTVTNRFATTDIINLTTSGTNSDYTVELLDAQGNPLSDTDGDGNLDTGVIDPDTAKNFILRVTPASSASNSDQTTIEATSYMDRQADPNNSTTQSIVKTTELTADGTTFICDNNFYLAQNDPSDYKIVNTTTNTLDQEFSIGVYTNAIGFNVRDGYIYGIDPDTGDIYRVSADGNAINLGNPPGATDRSFAGDVGGDGIYYLHRGSKIYKVNVTGLSKATDAGTIDLSRSLSADDISFNPVDDKLYAFDKTNDVIVAIDPDTGSITEFTTNYTSGTSPITQAGASYFDGFGNFYGYQNSDGRLVKFQLDLTTKTATGANFASGSTVSKNDGASCPYAPRIEKIVSPETVPAGQTVTYTYRIVNRNSFPFSGVNFVDTMPSSDGRTYVSESLNNPFGGTVNDYGSTQQLEIKGITLPAKTVEEIIVQVQVPETTPIGTVYNQAGLDNIPIGFGGPALPSDYPATGAFADPTPLEITAPVASDPNLILVKRITAINDKLTTNGGDDLSIFNNDPDTPDDDAPNWPEDDDTYLRGGINGGKVKPGDEVEYTIYFLSNGDQGADKVSFCDVIPFNTDFAEDTYSIDFGIAVASDPSTLPTLPTKVLSNFNDDDEGQFYPPGVQPPAVCKDPNNLAESLSAENNTTGAVVINLGNLPPVTSPGNPTNSYGFVRFRTKVR